LRRKSRLRNKSYKFFYITGALIILLSITLVILYGVYNKKLDDISKSMLPTEKIIGLVPNNIKDTQETESASSDLSKTIEEVKEDLNSHSKEEENVVNEVTTSTKEEEDVQVVTPEEEQVPEPEPEPKKELIFQYPVEGEVVREFSIENLIYSKTLDEWTIHQGIDIKADRTTVVKAAEEGTVASIKNDPRYGLTVIIEHEDGYKTIYSNLLTTEFVTEDEKVEKGQSIGTVGNSAVFEIADEPHLHFEIMKNGEYVDPKTVLK